MTCYRLPEAALSDSRYTPEAYEFLFESLEFTRKRLAEERGSKVRHISGVELLDGFRDLALEQFGLLARTVLATWRLNTTGDVGNMVYRLVESGDFLKTDEDSRSDFDNVYDFAEVFDDNYKIQGKS